MTKKQSPEHRGHGARGKVGVKGSRLTNSYLTPTPRPNASRTFRRGHEAADAKHIAIKEGFMNRHDRRAAAARAKNTRESEQDLYRFAPANFTAQDYEQASKLENKLRDIIAKDSASLSGRIVFTALITLFAEVLKSFPSPEAGQILQDLPDIIRRMNNHTDQEEEFIKKVMKQLPGMPEPRIMVQAPGAFHTSDLEQDAESAAQHFQEPGAIVSPEGRVLAYRVPRKGGWHE